MKRIALIAALIAAPARAGDAEISTVNEVLNKTPCQTLVRLVVSADPRGERERQLRTAAIGVLVGRATALGHVVDLYPNMKAEQARLVAGCDGRPDRSWMSILGD